jgi:hypothetical protein
MLKWIAKLFFNAHTNHTNTHTNTHTNDTEVELPENHWLRKVDANEIYNQITQLSCDEAAKRITEYLNKDIEGNLFTSNNDTVWLQIKLKKPCKFKSSCNESLYNVSVSLTTSRGNYSPYKVCHLLPSILKEYYNTFSYTEFDNLKAAIYYFIKRAYECNEYYGSNKVQDKIYNIVKYEKSCLGSYNSY